jgi:hypothetical protein
VTRSRRVLVSLGLAGFIAGSLYDIVRDEEHWPFSQYPMFSGVWRSRTFSWLRVFGVTRDGREFALDENRYVAPFDQSRLPKALKKILEQPDADSQVRQALRDVLTRYRVLATQGAHDGPVLDGLRLYELEWQLVPLPSPVEAPDRRNLIAEVWNR